MTVGFGGDPRACTALPKGRSPDAKQAFTGSAVRLAGFCGLVLGWTPETFWRATAAEVAACVAVLAPAGEQAVDGALLARMREALGDG